MSNLNETVTHFLDELNHPFREEIEQLRNTILSVSEGLTENIKWNGPNYCFNNEDRITMRIQPPTKKIQIIFHRGAKVQAQPNERLIEFDADFLIWKSNDRAIATFGDRQEIERGKVALEKIVIDWINAK
jgi:hypothetical protein